MCLAAATTAPVPSSLYTSPACPFKVCSHFPNKHPPLAKTATFVATSSTRVPSATTTIAVVTLLMSVHYPQLLQ